MVKVRFFAKLIFAVFCDFGLAKTVFFWLVNNIGMDAINNRADQKIEGICHGKC